MLDLLDSVTIDWADLDRATEITDALLHELANDQKTLRYLVENVPNDPNLFAKSERHRLLDKIVIYDALDRGFRIRLHFSTNEHLDRPHDHRFSFSSLILSGAYQHVRHKALGELDNSVSPSVQEDYTAIPTGFHVEPQFATTEEAGSFYTLHHTVIHTTVTADDTISLFIRGPAEKERSLIADRATGRLWWRYGESEESPERRARKTMDPAHYQILRTRLSRLGVI